MRVIRPSDPTVVAAKIALIGTVLTALATVAAVYVKPSEASGSGNQSAASSVNCLEVLDRFHAYLKEDPKRIDVFTAPGANGSLVLLGDTGGKQCGVNTETLKILMRTN